MKPAACFNYLPLPCCQIGTFWLGFRIPFIIFSGISEGSTHDHIRFTLVRSSASNPFKTWLFLTLALRLFHFFPWYPPSAISQERSFTSQTCVRFPCRRIRIDSGIVSSIVSWIVSWVVSWSVFLHRSRRALPGRFTESTQFGGSESTVSEVWGGRSI